MQKMQTLWKQVPLSVRRVLVFIIGMIFVIAAALTGWLPGPGGIPLFLIGISILATEFEWARTIRDKVLNWIKIGGIWFRKHLSTGLSIAVIALSLLTLGLMLRFYGN